MKRYLYHQILEDLQKKMVLLTGPRQGGKTFLAKQVMEEFQKPQYLNYDNIEDMQIIKNMSWAQNSDLLILDEIHKMDNWKNFIKGVYDTKPPGQSILVTGSARLETFKQTGDSLAGRYLHLRLNPLSVKEVLQQNITPFEALDLLNQYGAFPEPFLFSQQFSSEKANNESARWHNQYFTDIIREDIFDFSRINEINKMNLLIQLLRKRIGSPISYNAISEDLEVSPNTVKKYIEILESLYIIFLIRPFHRNVARALLKEPKVYFYDTAYIQGDEGVKLENTVAINLLKYVQFMFDTKGENIKLNYLKNKEHKEIDFVLTKNDKPVKFIEVKLSDKKLSNNLKYFFARFKDVEPIQLVHNLRQNQTVENINISKAAEWLAGLPV